MENLLPYEKVFFVHYQCQDLNLGTEIFSLWIYAKGNIISFKDKTEAENIFEYSKEVNKLQKEGLTLVHWNQNRPSYGTTHVTKRYKGLTGKVLDLNYLNGLNLAEFLVLKYGNEYIEHPRLDNLALLNGFSGIRSIEAGQRVFGENRITLLAKIYSNEVTGTLKTNTKSNIITKALTFKNPETLEKLFNDLKGYFPENEIEFKKALEGEALKAPIIFPHNQNKLVEVFRRLKYNGFLLNKPGEINKWICKNFQYSKKGIVENFKSDTVKGGLTGKTEPKNTERIKIDWLPYSNPEKLKRQKEAEKL